MSQRWLELQLPYSEPLPDTEEKDNMVKNMFRVFSIADLDYRFKRTFLLKIIQNDLSFQSINFENLLKILEHWKCIAAKEIFKVFENFEKVFSEVDGLRREIVLNNFEKKDPLETEIKIDMEKTQSIFFIILSFSCVCEGAPNKVVLTT